MDVAETPAPEVIAPPAETPTPDPTVVEEPASIAEHAEQFNTVDTPAVNGEESPETPPRAWSGKFIKGQTHRPQSKQAKPRDIEDIQAQTKRLRQAEQDAGITAPGRNPGESDRAYNLRRQADVAEALRDARKPAKPETRQENPQAAIAPSSGYKAVPFDKPKPKAADFQAADDPAEAWIEAVADWKLDKRIHEAQQVVLSRQSDESVRAAIQRGEQTKTALNGKIAEFEKTAPDFWAKMDEVDVPELHMPDVMVEAITSDLDNAPKLMYHLATHPDDLVQAIGFATPFQGEVTQQTVGLIRRMLGRYLSQTQGAGATPTGPSASATPVIVAHRPPRSVGTGPMQTGEEPPAEPQSIEEMRKYFHKARR